MNFCYRAAAGKSRICLFAAALAISPGAVFGDTPARHVVLIVWDGMRPDFISAAPTLERLARDGTRFIDHHSVYCTATDVNGAALATGCYPNKNGLFANSELYPAVDRRRPIDRGDPGNIQRGDEATQRKYLTAPTFVEKLRAAGKTTAVVGAKSVAMLFDRHNQWTVAMRENKPLTIFAAAPLPAEKRAQIQELLGPFLTGAHVVAAECNRYATHALTDYFWRDGVPDFSLLWLNEPDLAEHNFAPGSPEAIAAIKATDDDLALVLAALEKKKARTSTDLLVVSDHGFSTIKRSFDLVRIMREAGFRTGTEFSESPQPGDILIAGNGGSVLFYVREHERATTQRLVDWLQHQDFTGEIFAREKLEGTFSLGDIRIDVPNAPEVVMSFRSYDEKNQFGVSGMIDADWNRKAGEGTHATLGHADVNNLLVAAGPSFGKTPFIDVPTGNIDLAPTVLEILGLKVDASQFDGRSLTHIPNGASQGSGAQPGTRRGEHLSCEKDFPDGRWHQELKYSERGGARYFDSANGVFEKKKGNIEH